MKLDDLKGMPEIRHFMSPFPYWIDIDAPIAEARRMMLEKDIRHLPVMEGERIVGVLSGRDVEREMARPDGDTATVRRVDTGEPYVVDMHVRLDNVLLHMAAKHQAAALVFKGGRLAGIFTVSDACRELGRLLRHRFPPAGGDEAA